MNETGEPRDAARERIIARAGDGLARLQAKVQDALRSLREEEPGDFEREMGDQPLDAEDKALRRQVESYERTQERKDWAAIREISERNRRGDPK